MGSFFKKLAISSILAVCSAFSAVHSPVYANNITISNYSFDLQDTTAKTMRVQFDISWENSWRDAVNYDAAWIFMKYSTDGGLTWAHATMKTAGTNPSGGFSVGSGTTLDMIVPPDKKGAFIQRAANGSGTLNATGVRLVWDYGADIAGSDENAAISVIKIFGIEMVYIPAGPFYIGDGNGSTESLSAFHQTANTAVQLDTTLKQNIIGIGIKGDGGLDTDNNGTIDNPNFPTGYKAFYLMKYEMSQGQFRDFFNTLTRAQQNFWFSTLATDAITNTYFMANTTTVTNRNSLRAPPSANGTTAPVIVGCDLNGNGNFNESNDGEWIACNFLKGWQVASYADWAALRPMSELEYEKAARGPVPPVYGEFAWGSTAFTVPGPPITNDGRINEVVPQSGIGLANTNNLNSVTGGIEGPVRCGFAATFASRAEAGASYYGIMELTSNVRESVVGVGIPDERSFNGANGDGSLGPTGIYTVAGWPNDIWSFKGGGWTNVLDPAWSSVSNRRAIAGSNGTFPSVDGGRCARSE